MKKCNVHRIVAIVSGLCLVLVLAAVLVPVFFFDQFRIGGESMNPTLERGDHILVDKMLMGARIYKRYDFSNPELDCFRMPGIRGIRTGDIAVFNFPYGREWGKIGFRINYVYAKRCIGCPGDTVWIEDGFYRNSNTPGMVIGSKKMQGMLASTPDTVLLSNPSVRNIPYARVQGWTIRDFGPMYIPGAGDRIPLNAETVKFYGAQIEYETGCRPDAIDGRVLIGGQPYEEYEFRTDWYFFGGDNVLNSKDSRYVGLVPEDYIVGVADRILFSRNPYTGKFDWGRFMKKIKD